MEHYQTTSPQELTGRQLDKAVAVEVMDDPERWLRRYSEHMEAALEAWESMDHDDVIMLCREIVQGERHFSAGPAMGSPAYIDPESTYFGPTAPTALCRALVAVTRANKGQLTG